MRCLSQTDNSTKNSRSVWMQSVGDGASLKFRPELIVNFTYSSIKGCIPAKRGAGSIWAMAGLLSR